MKNDLHDIANYTDIVHFIEVLLTEWTEERLRITVGLSPPRFESHSVDPSVLKLLNKLESRWGFFGAHHQLHMIPVIIV